MTQNRISGAWGLAFLMDFFLIQTWLSGVQIKCHSVPPPLQSSHSKNSLSLEVLSGDPPWWQCSNREAETKSQEPRAWSWLCQWFAVRPQARAHPLWGLSSSSVNRNNNSITRILPLVVGESENKCEDNMRECKEYYLAALWHLDW